MYGINDLIELPNLFKTVLPVFENIRTQIVFFSLTFRLSRMYSCEHKCEYE